MFIRKYFISFLLFYSVSALAQDSSVFTIAFGSCNRQDLQQPLWDPIIKENPDLWIWLGDNIYGDTDDMSIMKTKYERQNENKGYKELKSRVPIIGTWDDHDYGLNDAGSGYKQKKESQKLALEFYGEEVDSDRWKRKGIYASYNYESKGVRVKVILLDTRYNRDTVSKKNKVYVPNREGDILGAEQWEWLESELRNSGANVNIIGSSIQVIAKDHNYEKWANFPTARERLFDLIAETKAKGVMFLSGDRHIAEISKYKHKKVKYPLFDVTSSGLTHTWSSQGEEYNEYRLGKLTIKLNYGLLKISARGNHTEVDVKIKGEGGVLLEEHTIKF